MPKSKALLQGLLRGLLHGVTPFGLVGRWPALSLQLHGCAHVKSMCARDENPGPALIGGRQSQPRLERRGYRGLCSTNDVANSAPCSLGAFTMSPSREVLLGYLFHDIVPSTRGCGSLSNMHATTVFRAPRRQDRRVDWRRALSRVYLFDRGGARLCAERRTCDLADRKFCNPASFASDMYRSR